MARFGGPLLGQPPRRNDMSWTYYNPDGEPIIRDGEAVKPKLSDHAVIARWLSNDRCEGYEFQADGTLWVRTRQTPSEVWSPPKSVGFMAAGINELQELLASLTGSHPNTNHIAS
jgi:hypothetical protein